MPTYEYLCGKCGKFEEIQSIKAQALKECPVCHGPVKRIISGGGGMIFKGSGFYLTDNRSSDYKAREKADKSPAPAAPASSDTQSQAKPAGIKESPAPAKAAENPPAKPSAPEPTVKPSSGGDAKP